MRFNPSVKGARIAVSTLFLAPTWVKVYGLAAKQCLTKSLEPNHIGRREAIWSVASVVSVASPHSSAALSPLEAEEQYDRYAATYDQLDGGKASEVLGIEDARLALIEKARGKVLEIGVGTGLNLDKYLEQNISSLTWVDISDGMLQEAKSKIKTLPSLNGIPVDFIRADATLDLVDRFGSGTFDTVVDSFSLCVLGNEGALRCLDQLSQVVRSRQNGGRLLLLENSRSSNPFLGLYQDATADFTASAGGKGCLYNQDVKQLIQSTKGLDIIEEKEYLAGIFRSYECVRN